MKYKIKKTVIILITIMALNSTAYATDILKFSSKTVTKNKQWTINFNKQIKDENIKDYICILDKNNKYVDVDLKLENNKKSVIVIPPNNGYHSNEQYILIVKDGLRPLVGEKLKNKVQFEFTIKSDNVPLAGAGAGAGAGAHKENDKYIAIANVIVSPIMPMFKSIIINTSEKNIKKYKVEGNNNIFNIGEKIITLASKDKLEVVFYDDKDKVIGKGILNVDKNENNLSIKIK